MIIVAKLVPVYPDKVFLISVNEAEIVAEVFHKIGKIAAIRVARAFAKCDLSSAVKYIRSLED